MSSIGSSVSLMAVRGSIWTLFGYGGSQTFRLLSNLILAWLLFPEAFGLMALINVFMLGLQLFSDIGIGPNIIRHQGPLDARFLNTGWTIQVIRGFALWIVACILVYPLSHFYEAVDPLYASLPTLIPVAALITIISGFNSTGIFLLNRDMKLKMLAGLELIPQFFSSVIMISWAFLVPSIWALVAGTLAGSIIKLWLSHIWNPGLKNKFCFDTDNFIIFFNFGKWIFLSTIAGFTAVNLDRLILSRIVSLTELGIYSLALTLALVGINIAERLSNIVIFPLLSRLQNDPNLLINSCLKSRHFVLLLSGCACVCFALFAPLFFQVLYDDRYADAGKIAQWLSLYVWFRILNLSMDRIPLALGYPKHIFIANMCSIFVMPLSILAYDLFLMPGFIMVMTLSCMSFHIYLLATLPHGVLKMVRQDIIFTGSFLLYTLPIIFLVNNLHLSFSPLIQLIYIGIFLIPLGMFSAHQLVRLLKNRPLS